jgi:hypothetical protein
MDLAQEAAAKRPKCTLDEQLPEWLKDFKDVFELKSFNQLPPFKPGFDHAINLKPDAPEVSPFKIYPLSPSQKIAMKEFIEEHKKTGRIRESKLPYGAPAFFVPKADRKERTIIDYHWLNKWTIKDKYPLPRIETILDDL